MVFDADDLSLFCDPAMPGHAVATLTGGVTVDVLFGAPYAEVFGAIAGERPVAVCKSGAIAPGAAVTIHGVAYTALMARPQRGGMVAVDLDKAS